MRPILPDIVTFILIVSCCLASTNTMSTQPNFDILASKPPSNAFWQFIGINLSGLEMGKNMVPANAPNLALQDVHTPQSDLSATQSFMNAGMNTVRIPIRWGYLQLDGAGQGEMNLAYYNTYVKPLLESLTSAKIYTILSLHSYMHYAIAGKGYSGCVMRGKCPDGMLVLDPSAYVDVWSKLYALIKHDAKINSAYLLFDLLHQPVDVPEDFVFTVQVPVIKSLRQQGFKGYILVEGNAWSGLHNWTTTTWKSHDGNTTYSNATLFTRAHFAEAGIKDLSKILISVYQFFDEDYSGTHDTCLTDLTTQGEQGFNLNAFTHYLQANQLNAIVTEIGTGRDQKTCEVALKSFFDYLKNNAVQQKNSGFAGWILWNTGHALGNYHFRVKPDGYQMKVVKPYLSP